MPAYIETDSDRAFTMFLAAEVMREQWRLEALRADLLLARRAGFRAPRRSRAVPKPKRVRRVPIQPAGMTYERALEIAIEVFDRQNKREKAAA